MKITIKIDGKETTTTPEEWEKVYIELSKLFLKKKGSIPFPLPNSDPPNPPYQPPRDYPWYPSPYDNGPWCSSNSSGPGARG